jgi:predicted nuclease with TOPRIM domain
MNHHTPNLLLRIAALQKENDELRETIDEMQSDIYWLTNRPEESLEDYLAAENERLQDTLIELEEAYAVLFYQLQGERNV